MKRRVVITGIGVISPNGIGKENFWNALKEGKSGIKDRRIAPPPVPAKGLYFKNAKY